MTKIASLKHIIKSKVIPKTMVPLKLVGIDNMLFNSNRKNLDLKIHDIKNYSIDTSKEYDIKHVKQLLKKEGIVILNNFFDKNIFDNVDLEIKQFIESLQQNIEESGNNFGEFRNILWQYFGYRHNGKEISSKPIVNIRNKDKSQDDGGMIDIFNVDRMFDRETMPLTTAVIQNVFNDKLNNLTKELIPSTKSRYNLYINNSVKNTRGPHRDDYHSTYKVFIYLTDVDQIEDGPYGFIPGSHLNDRFLKKEIQLNKLFGKKFGDISEIPDENFLKCIGKKGSIIISDQSAIHKGFPQHEGHTRMAFVKSLF